MTEIVEHNTILRNSTVQSKKQQQMC